MVEHGGYSDTSLIASSCQRQVESEEDVKILHPTCCSDAFGLGAFLYSCNWCLFTRSVLDRQPSRALDIHRPSATEVGEVWQNVPAKCAKRFIDIYAFARTFTRVSLVTRTLCPVTRRLDLLVCRLCSRRGCRLRSRRHRHFRGCPCLPPFSLSPSPPLRRVDFSAPTS